jgi:hypothetical protein
MKVKLFIEPKGKAREEVLLESCVPFDMKSFKQWQECWISNKDYNSWKKAAWDSQVLGEFHEGKIVSATVRDSEDYPSLKGPLLAYRSYVTDTAGAKNKLPMVLFGHPKKIYGINPFKEKMELNKDQESEIKQYLKSDPWAPISVWHPQPVDRKYEIEVSDVLQHAIRYTQALFECNLIIGGWSSFSATEQFK